MNRLRCNLAWLLRVMARALFARADAIDPVNVRIHPLDSVLLQVNVAAGHLTEIQARRVARQLAAERRG